MTACPFCELRAGRGEVHAHMVSEHPERLEVWTEAETGRMRYRVACPSCGDAYEHRVKPRWTDSGFLDEFAREIRMVGYDQLLNHVEAEHGPPDATSPDAPAPGGGALNVKRVTGEP